MGEAARNRDDFVAPEEKAKSAAIAKIVRIARKEHFSYAEFLYVCQQARKKLGLRKPRTERKLPHVLSMTQLRRFFRGIQECGDLQHEIMLKLLFYTAVRVSELVKIRVGDVDVDQCKIFIDRGKGGKDRYILFPEGFRLVLRSHLQAHPRNRYLFESGRHGPFTPRRIQQIVQDYRLRAGITQPQ
jgi:integrase/recombinase XerD